MNEINQISADKKLIQQCIAGKHRAQKELYNKYNKAMYHTIIRMIPYPAEAEDVLQEVFIKVFNNLSSYKATASLGAWIKKIAINTSLKANRKRRAFDFESIENITEKAVKETAKHDMSVGYIHKQIKRLPDGCRIIFNLYLMEGYSHSEISQILNISESTSKSQYQRAKLLLRKSINQL